MRTEAADRLPASSCEAASDLLQALAHPVRLRIVCGLLDGSCGVGSIVDCLALPQAFVSRHLAILREAGVISAVTEGRRRVYRVCHPAVPPLVDALCHSFRGASP